MSETGTTPYPSRPPSALDYSLVGKNAARAVEAGLAEADWYQSPVPRAQMRKLLERRDGPAIRDTLLWFGLIFGSGVAAYLLWPTWWALPMFLVYGVLYASTSDSRWHEAGHGTAFKTDWMNIALYEIASFMVMRESTVWRWSHTRHHSDTIIVGRDPEIAVPRPPRVWAIVLNFLNWGGYPKYFKGILMHSAGRMSAEEKTYIPESEFPKIYRKARICVAIYAAVIALAICTRSILPLLYVGLANVYGTWLSGVYGLTQHTGLAENVLDHRLNCRTVRMCLVNRYLYWNMNFHVEHHMFPLVPYHALPRLHELVKDDMPDPYPSLWAAWREIIPSVLRQVKDPVYHVKRVLPERKGMPPSSFASGSEKRAVGPDGWLQVGAGGLLARSDVIRFDHGSRTYALYRDEEGKLYGTDGMCTHGNTHLADGLVKGGIIECPKHNGRFNLADGSPARAPICLGLTTYPVEEKDGQLYINLLQPGGAGMRRQREFTFRVVGNRNVSTFIREIVIEPTDPSGPVEFRPGDYLQFRIPTYDQIAFAQFDIPEPYAAVWRTHRLFDLVASNPGPARRNNYSIASNGKREKGLRFNVRIATPPPGQDCPPGVGSAYMFHLRPGDEVTAIGPFGDFHIKPTGKEMVYIGGGAGMAPLRAHLSHLLETENSPRKISFWYGARSRQELFYESVFEEMAAKHPNFSFHVALSTPLPEDRWEGHSGFIHEVVRDLYLERHLNPKAVEYYLCGPPMMIKACTKMLAELGVPAGQISYDEF